ncbi:hypothetical protein GCM10009087_27990 [Sphingomonas oligophenolica]|uniref:Carboxypeptidase-like regulatory domain-containing protein n=1 Tax=Sphingomonas oligophenolica TaxID=301154 RepID=A0ABU9Y4J5_9SPHN
MANTEILFPEPCHEDWEAMRPDERGRHCAACDKKVHDLATYTPEEAERLLLSGETPACLRVTILPDGRVATLPGRRGRFLMAAIGTPALMLAAASATAGPETGAIAGSVRSPDIAPVRVTALAAGVRRSTTANDAGVYRFDHLPPGTYTLVFSSADHRKWSIDKVAVRANRVVRRDSYDPAMPIMHTTGIVASPPR